VPDPRAEGVGVPRRARLAIASFTICPRWPGGLNFDDADDVVVGIAFDVLHRDRPHGLKGPLSGLACLVGERWAMASQACWMACSALTRAAEVASVRKSPKVCSLTMTFSPPAIRRRPFGCS
jgi:hypothetical protein